MKESLYLTPFSSCLFSKGASQSIILDTQRYNILVIPNTLVDFINEAKENPIGILRKKYQSSQETINEYIDFVLNEEICFLSTNEDKKLFKELTLSWDAPSNITNSIIDINKNTNYNICSTIIELDNLNCLHLQIRFFDLIEKNVLYNIFNIIKESSIRSIEIICDFKNFASEQEIIRISNVYKNISSIYIYNASGNKDTSKIKRQDKVFFYPSEIKSNYQCGIIDAGLFNKNIEHYSESQKHNTCLNRKISIDVNGEIKNCPSMQKSYGNIKNTTLKEAIEKHGFKDLWYIHKDKIEVCKDCEFRHICTDCRAFLKNPENIYSQPEKCNYNPYIAKWKGQKGYITVKDWKKQTVF